jgi:multidrug efflux pump subunit AcrA (membrane-fusion protein)
MLPPKILRASVNAVSRFTVDQAISKRDLAAVDLEVHARNSRRPTTSSRAPGSPHRLPASSRTASDTLYVIRVSNDRRAERVDVKAGLADGDWIGVEGKLSPGDEVVVRGGEPLRGNEKLQVVGVFEMDR